MVPLMMLLAAYDTDASANGIDYHKIVAPLFNCLDLRNARCHWWWCPDHKMLSLMQWHHMTTTPRPLVSCKANVDVKGFTLQKNDVAPHFNCLNLRKEMLPLINWWYFWCHMTLMAVPMVPNNQSCCTSHQLFYLRNVMLFLVPLTSCDASTSANVAPHFDYLDYTNAVFYRMVFKSIIQFVIRTCISL